jgi:MoxR-like ATPase
MTEAASLITALRENINSVVLGKAEVIESCLTALLAGEHLLLEDVPGVGKTLVGKAIARSIAGEFRRIQFTSDLLPSDIVGSNIFNTRTSEFSFHKGPIFANVVLADEINRAPPRTQSALLEAMSERQVSVDGETLALPNPFIVIATQNPFEMEGTYSLPESQMDRFLLRISMGYPGRNEERQVLASHRQVDPVSELKSVVTFEQLQQIQTQVREVKVDAAIENYLLAIERERRTSCVSALAPERFLASIGRLRRRPCLPAGISSFPMTSKHSRSPPCPIALSPKDYCEPDSAARSRRY